jgi:hypothetical protein
MGGGLDDDPGKILPAVHHYLLSRKYAWVKPTNLGDADKSIAETSGHHTNGVHVGSQQQGGGLAVGVSPAPAPQTLQAAQAAGA